MIKKDDLAQKSDLIKNKGDDIANEDNWFKKIEEKTSNGEIVTKSRYQYVNKADT